MKLPPLSRRLLATSIVLATFLVAPAQIAPSAHAAAPTQLITISPSSDALSSDPGSSVKGTFDVVNEGDTAYKVSVSSSPYHVEGLNYDPNFTQLPGTVDASQWVKFGSVTTQSLAAKRLLTINFTVNVPAGTQPGGYYAVVFAESSTSDTTGVVPHGRVGDILYITVNGTVKVSGMVSGPKVPFYNAGTPTTLGVIIGNDGGVHFQTTVDVTVKSIFGKTVFSASDNRYVLPQTQREVSETWTPTSPIGIYKVDRSASIPAGTKQLMTRWIVVVQPWVYIGLVGLILVIIATIGLFRQYRKRGMR